MPSAAGTVDRTYQQEEGTIAALPSLFADTQRRYLGQLMQLAALLAYLGRTRLVAFTYFHTPLPP